MAGRKILISNKKANFEYQILEKFEAGIELQGTEVKSLREGKGNLKESWVGIDNGEVYLKQAHISHYTFGNAMNHEETRPRKLLLHRKEILKLEKAVEAKGLTLVPLHVYLRGQLVKVEIALGKGKKLHDKRESAKEKDANRQIERAMKHNR